MRSPINTGATIVKLHKRDQSAPNPEIVGRQASKAYGPDPGPHPNELPAADVITPDPLEAGRQATEARAPSASAHPSGGKNKAGLAIAPFPRQVSGPQKDDPLPVRAPIPMTVEGSISHEQLIRRGLALTPGHVGSSIPSEALKPQPTEPAVPFATPGDGSDNDALKNNFGITRL